MPTPSPRKLKAAAAVTVASTLATLGALTAAPAAHAHAHLLDDKQTATAGPTVVVELTPGDRLRGQVVSFDETHLTLSVDGTEQRVAWSGVRGRSAGLVLRRAVAPDDAAGWVMAGSVLARLDGAGTEADAAFARALRIDPALEEDVATARREAAEARLNPEPAPDGDAASDADAGAGVGAAGAADAPGGAAAGILGELPNSWDDLTDDEHEAFIETNDARYRQVLDAMSLEYDVVDTDHFRIYTNLSAGDSRASSRMLERMYDRLVDMFGLEDGARVYAGKCFVVLTATQDQYTRFNQMCYGNPAAGSAGVCWQSPDGTVQMSAWNGGDATDFLHTLVHENVHGFLFRYRTPIMIPNWANEGLAEVIAEMLVSGGLSPRAQDYADRLLRAGQPLGTYFDDANIQGWCYGLSYGLTTLMIQQNRTGYRDFIIDIKAGTPWRESLADHFGGATPDRLVNIYKQAQGIR